MYIEFLQERTTANSLKTRLRNGGLEMHYHMEVILPPNTNVDEALKVILEPFSEENEEASHSFWDWWQQGGRYAGSKALCHLPPNKLDEFYAWMTEEKITVSGLIWGKQELDPPSQIPKVDGKWKELFDLDTPCTLFKHCNNGDGSVAGDVCTLKEALPASCHRIIIAGPSYDGSMSAQYMIAQSEWNGVIHVDSKWDGKVGSAIEMFKDSMKNYKEEWQQTHTPQDDWIAVTVDYHY